MFRINADMITYLFNKDDFPEFGSPITKTFKLVCFMSCKICFPSSDNNSSFGFGAFLK